MNEEINIQSLVDALIERIAQLELEVAILKSMNPHQDFEPLPESDPGHGPGYL